ncbi:histidinol dehydrogenase [Microbacterium sp. YY-03]|uniref:histidinol dehydrogenase n=1 Tax=Microbacterium sp. YY-03 TaxID=3421636 RepID=UPI003D16DA1B
MQLFSRILTWVMAFVLGALFGAAGTIGYASMPAGLPLGFVVGIVGCAAILVAIRMITEDRIAAAVAGAGMLGALLLFSGVGPGGSVVVPDSVLGMVWSLGLTAVVVAIVAWPSASRLRALNPK